MLRFSYGLAAEIPGLQPCNGLTGARGFTLKIPISPGLKLNVQKTKLMASGPITSWQIDGERIVTDFIFWAPKSLQKVTAAMKLKYTFSLEEKL